MQESIIDLTGKPGKAVRGRKKSRNVVEVCFSDNYKLCIPGRTLHMMVYTLSQIMKGVHKYVAVPLKGGRFLYIGYFENSFLIAIESWHRQPILMLIGMEHVKHLYKSTASLFEAVFDQTSQTHFPKPGSMAYFLWEQNRIGQVGRS